jgi:pimeloyl-ACP methyl ester carboxylesterase
VVEAYRKNQPLVAPEPGMMMINIAQAEAPLGQPIMSESELAVFVSAFGTSGFTGSINWYRNPDRNWHLLADVDPIVDTPALMIRGEHDVIPKFERLSKFVPNVEEVSLDCGHWTQQELPDETTHAILNWLERRASA